MIKKIFIGLVLQLLVMNSFSQSNVLVHQSMSKMGIDSAWVYQQVDSIANNGIRQGAFPGCQILVAKNGNIFFHKTYGYHTYDSIQPVLKENLYDFASISKITTALPAIMQLVDQKKIDLHAPMRLYWSDFEDTDKAELTLQEILAHQAGLYPWIAYWKSTVRQNGHFKWFTFREDSSARYPYAVSENLFAHKNARKRIYKAIKERPLTGKKTYQYSGLAFYLFPAIVEQITHTDSESYLKDNIYAPIGANSLCYRPYRYYPKSKIIPTERDSFFRMSLLHGYVHDEGAAIMGGLSSNAGLFGTTEDLAKLMQMYLNGGIYNNKRILSDSVVHLFTQRAFPETDNRRGLGFDKPLLKNKQGSSALDASANSFGHAGYTGTFVWADPDNGLLFIFMSNRVFPTRENRKIYQLNIRPSIHQIFYDACK